MNHYFLPHPDYNPFAEKRIEHYSYTYNSQLGEGSFSKVYLGLDEITGEKVAIKVINMALINNDLLMKMLVREIKILKQLDHPNIVKCLDVFSTPNNTYIITEFCEGGDLGTIITRMGRIPEVEAIRVMKDVLAGFKELLKQGVVHRDLKPANIFIKNNMYKLGDFGFANVVPDTESLLTSQLGTPLYMSPQMLQNDYYTSKSDIWSLGVIFYEMMFGCIPWACRDQIELIHNIMNAPVMFPLNIPISEESRDFIIKCLQIDERRRISWESIYEHEIFCNDGGAYSGKKINAEGKKRNKSSICEEVKKHKESIVVAPPVRELVLPPNPYMLGDQNLVFIKPGGNADPSWQSPAPQTGWDDYYGGRMEYEKSAKRPASEQCEYMRLLYEEFYAQGGVYRGATVPERQRRPQPGFQPAGAVNYQESLLQEYYQIETEKNEAIVTSMANLAELLRILCTEAETVQYMVKLGKPLLLEKTLFILQKAGLILTGDAMRAINSKENVYGLNEWLYFQETPQFKSFKSRIDSHYRNFSTGLSTLYSKFNEKYIDKLFVEDDWFLEIYNLKDSGNVNFFKTVHDRVFSLLKDVIVAVDERISASIHPKFLHDEYILLRYVLLLFNYLEISTLFNEEGSNLYSFALRTNFPNVFNVGRRPPEELFGVFLRIKSQFKV